MAGRSVRWDSAEDRGTGEARRTPLIHGEICALHGPGIQRGVGNATRKTRGGTPPLPDSALARSDRRGAVAAPANATGVQAINLPRREAQVLEGVVLGLTNREIAEWLGISRHTVATYISSLLAKLEVRNRTALAAKAGSLNGRRLVRS